MQWRHDAIPVPEQTTGDHKKTGEKYITKADTSTVSWVDFGCKKLMLLYAVLAAIAAIAACLIVATGGMALVLIAAAAGAAGAVLGSVVGSAICGQKVAPVRMWLDSNNSFQILGIDTIVGNHKMVCNAFTMLGMSPEFITFNPQVKSWTQAIKMGAASFVANVLQGAMTGMMLGAAAVALPAMLEGGVAAFGEGGAVQVARFLGGNAIRNYAASWLTGEGLALRFGMGVQSSLDAYGQTGTATNGDFDKGLTGMESGTAESVKNIASGSTNPLDYIGVALWFTPVGDMVKGKETKSGNSENGGNTTENKTSTDNENKNDKTPITETQPETEHTAESGGGRKCMAGWK